MKPLSTGDPLSVGSYRLLGVLGGGGMGRVYLGQSPTGQRVAIKVIRTELAEDAVFRRRFTREVAAARAVNPLFSAAVVDADPEADQPWLASTYIDGPSLQHFVDEHGPLSPAAVQTLGAGLAAGLASIHQAGLVHRDLKPSNVLLDDEGPHIIDFGIAIASDSTRMTTSMVVGTPSYMAPERLRGSEAGPPADVFSLGATLYFAATGASLVRDGSMYAQVLQITTGRFDLSIVDSSVRPLVARSISQHEKDRPTAAELGRILVASGARPAEPGWYADVVPRAVASAPVANRRLSRRRVLAFGGAAGLAGLGAGVGAAAGLFVSGPDRVTPTGTRQPVTPGTVIWQAGSGAAEAGLVGAAGSGVRMVVDGGVRLVAVHGSSVAAVDLRGNQVWAAQMSTTLLDIRQWDDGVLVADPQRLWLLDARTGVTRFLADLAVDEAVRARSDNADRIPIELHHTAVAPSAAFVNLGTATVAIDRAGKVRWRQPRPPARGGVRPSAGDPLVADDRWLITHDVVGSASVVAGHDARDGRQVWSTSYRLPVTPMQPQPPPDGPTGPPPSGEPPEGRPPTGELPGPSGPPGDRPGGGPADPAWSRSEGRLAGTYLAVRDASQFHILSLVDGRQGWTRTSTTPVTALELLGDLVLVAADQLTAYAVDSGAVVWPVNLRGARLAVTAGRDLMVAAVEDEVVALDRLGVVQWRTRYPDQVSGAVAEQVVIEGDTAYVIFRPGSNQRPPLAVDVIAIAIGVPP
jgi:outer membrane protein assembly factor BamB/predicted Ser/Thr protein kinase